MNQRLLPSLSCAMRPQVSRPSAGPAPLPNRRRDRSLQTGRPNNSSVGALLRRASKTWLSRPRTFGSLLSEMSSKAFSFWFLLWCLRWHHAKIIVRIIYIIVIIIIVIYTMWSIVSPCPVPTWNFSRSPKELTFAQPGKQRWPLGARVKEWNVVMPEPGEAFRRDKLLQLSKSFFDRPVRPHQQHCRDSNPGLDVVRGERPQHGADALVDLLSIPHRSWNTKRFVRLRCRSKIRKIKPTKTSSFSCSATPRQHLNCTTFSLHSWRAFHYQIMANVMGIMQKTRFGCRSC